jgi:hypothetical protein
MTVLVDVFKVIRAKSDNNKLSGEELSSCLRTVSELFHIGRRCLSLLLMCVFFLFVEIEVKKI